MDKIVQVSEVLLALAENLAKLQQESFVGAEADEILMKIQQVCHMEWESDKDSRALARRYLGAEKVELDAVEIILLDKLCRNLAGIADNAENVGKNLRLMIIRR